jgi:hypothetical protein
LKTNPPLDEGMNQELLALFDGHPDPDFLYDAACDLLAEADEGGPASMVEAVRRVLEIQSAIRAARGIISAAGHA